MIKVLIVEDELLVRVGIKSCINWQEHGFELIGEAQNGVEALKIIEDTRPDIIITDIKMPKMDGIALLKELSLRNETIHTIILSCYNEFEYVREAMKYGAKDYILKLSMHSQELLEILNNLKQKIIEQQSKTTLAMDIKQINVQDLRHKFYERFFNGEYQDKTQIKNVLSNLSLKIQIDDITIIYFTIDNYHDVVKNLEHNDSNYIKTLVTNTLLEIIPTLPCCDFIGISNKEYAVIGSFQKSTISPGDVCTKISDSLSIFANLSSSFGISQPCTNYILIKEHFEQAKLALSYKFYKGNKSINYFSNLPKFHDSCEYYDFKIEKEYYEALLNGDLSYIQSLLNKIIDKMVNCKCSYAKFYTTLNEIMNTYSRVLKFYDRTLHDFEAIYGLTTRKTLADFDTLESTKEWLNSFNISFNEYLLNEKAKKYRSEISTIIDYIREHYAEEITLNTAASYVNISPARFSTVFKQETGTTFISFLTNLRIEKAKELIQHNDMMIYEVSKNVGYPNANYFGKLFKKVTGLTPDEFKNGSVTPINKIL